MRRAGVERAGGEARLSLWRELRQSSARVTHDTHDTTGTQTQTQTQTQTHTALPSAFLRGQALNQRVEALRTAHVGTWGSDEPPLVIWDERRQKVAAVQERPTAETCPSDYTFVCGDALP